MILTRRTWLAGAGAVLLSPGAGVAAEVDWARLESERRRLTARALRLFHQAGVGTGWGDEVGRYYSALWLDERYLYPDSEAGRSRAVADMNLVLAARAAELPSLIDSIPAAFLDLEVRTLTAAEIAGGRGGYRELPGSGKRGAYVIDLKDIRRRPRWTLPSVVAHELLPGHFVQAAVPARTPHPAGFSEGWAIYAESLVAYRNPLDELGKLHWLLFRVCRALADLGVHTRGWSIDEARAQLVAWQGEPAYFAPFETDFARIAREPGVRIAEAKAWLAIADGARGRTGAALQSYHRAVLTGARP